MPELEDNIYIEKTINGDCHAYGKLVDKYKSRVYTLALRIVKYSPEAEEVAQDAFMKAFKALPKFKKEAKFSTWLYRIVYNTALTKVSKKKLDMMSLDQTHIELNGAHIESGHQLVVEDRKKYLNHALSQLPEEEAVMINLYYTHDKDMHEIGAIMGMTHGNVRVKLSRSRKKLYALLQNALKHELKNIL